MTAKPHHLKIFPQKACVVCNTLFRPRSGVHKYCSISCREKHNQNAGSMQVKRQYERISGNWEKYFKRLLAQKYRDGLKLEEVLAVLKKQNYSAKADALHPPTGVHRYSDLDRASRHHGWCEPPTSAWLALGHHPGSYSGDHALPARHRICAGDH